MKYLTYRESDGVNVLMNFTPCYTEPGSICASRICRCAFAIHFSHAPPPPFPQPLQTKDMYMCNLILCNLILYIVYTYTVSEVNITRQTAKERTSLMRTTVYRQDNFIFCVKDSFTNTG